MNQKKNNDRKPHETNEKKIGIAVVGGANVDIKGIADTSFRKGSSNPGTVYKAAGGVARNVADNLGRLQIPTTLFTMVGLDEDGDFLLHKTKESGVDITHIHRVVGENTGKYLSILDENKEQIGSIADMRIIDKMDEKFIESILPELNNKKVVFVDTNLPKKSLLKFLQWLRYNKFLIAIDPVSVKKAEKLKGNLEGIWLLTPNKEEAEVLTGKIIQNSEDIKSAAEILLSKGVNQVVITLGDKGVFVATEQYHLHLPSPKVNVKDTTGAGDAFIAGLLFGLYMNYTLKESCIYAHTLAAITLERDETVAKDLTISLLEKQKRSMKKHVR